MKRMSALSLLLSPMSLAIFPTASKAVGSGFRCKVDYRNAPPEIRHNAVRRESALLALTFLSNLAIQTLTAKRLPALLKAIAPALMKDPVVGEAASLVGRLVLTLPGTFMAEWLSRRIGKPPNWQQTTGNTVPAAPLPTVSSKDAHHNNNDNAPTKAPNPFAAVNTPFAGRITMSGQASARPLR